MKDHKQGNDNDNNDNVIIFNDFGNVNYDITLGNPLKGFANILSSSIEERTKQKQDQKQCQKRDDADIDNENKIWAHSLEHYYIGFDNVCYKENETILFKWDMVEDILNDCKERGKHAIIRFYIHYPGQTLSLPTFLIDTVKMVEYSSTKHGTGISPVYNDPILLNVLQQFINEFGIKYDGDQRIGFIQCGLLGFWGEWHTFENPGMLSEYTKDIVYIWYHNAFQYTKLQLRNARDINLKSNPTYNDIKELPSELFDHFPPIKQKLNNNDNDNDEDNNNKDNVKYHMGYHDDSYCYRTLDGMEYNGVDKIQPFFFWRKLITINQDTFWLTQVMGGEFFPSLVPIVFDNEHYPTRTPFHQDLLDCIINTHTTYLKCGNIFAINNKKVTNEMIIKAKNASVHMGYNFIIKQIEIIKNNHNDNTVIVNVIIQQIGVAPFYYPLDLVIKLIHGKDDEEKEKNKKNKKVYVCSNIEKNLIHMNDTYTCTFHNIPMDDIISTNDSTTIQIKLKSKMLYDKYPIKFAQGNGKVIATIT